MASGKGSNQYKTKLKKDNGRGVWHVASSHTIGSTEYIKDQATDPNTPIEVLEKLSIYPDVTIRAALTSNVSLPTRIRKRMAHEETDIKILMGLGNSPYTPPEVLRHLSAHKNTNVQYQVAANPSTPPDVLDTYAKSKDADIRKALAYNPSCPPPYFEGIS